MMLRLAGALVLLVGADAAAYTTLTNPPSRWERHNIPVRWSLNQNGSDDIGIDASEIAARAAFQVWQDVDCCYIAFNYLGRTSRVARPFDRFNDVSWSEGHWQYDPRAVAITGVAFGPATIVEADIECNGVYMRWTTDGSGVIDAQAVLAHEVGHFLGLGDLYGPQDRDATMFGLVTGTGARTLSEDDEAGCRFLYPEPCGGTTGCTSDADCPPGYRCEAPNCVRVTGTGGMCAPCSSSADCANGLCVSGFVDGRRYCGVNCSSDADCGPGNRCFRVTGGPAQCAPANLDCRQSTPGCRTDTDCPPGHRCDGGTCVPDVVVECNVDTDCGPGERCQDNECVRVEPRLRAFGEECESDEQCGSHLCVDGLCSRSCSPLRPVGECGEGFYCDAVRCETGVCRPGGPGTSPNGSPCETDTECESAFCDTSLGGVCLTPCDPSSLDTGCGFGETCQPTESAACGVCQCGAGMFGDVCASDLDCAFGLCRAAEPGQLARCTSDCSDGRCPAGSTCQTVQSPVDGSPEQRCIVHGQYLGGSCTAHEECQSGWCAPYGNWLFCTRPCSAECSCPIHMACVTVAGAGPICIPIEVLKDDGCGCRVAGRSRAPAWLALALLALVLWLRSLRRG